MAQMSIGSRIRKSPYYESTIRAGVRAFTVYNHMYMPTSYGNPGAEYRRLTEGVALWDVAVERQVEIAGPGAVALSNHLSARDLQGLRVGRARYAPLCDHDGRLINDPVVLRVAPDRFWFSLADSDVLLWARAIAGERGHDVKVFEPDVSPLAIQGPKAEALAEDLFGAEVVGSLGFFHHRPVELDGIPIVLCRSGWSKQGGFELFLTDGTRGNQLWDLVMSAGEQYGIGPGSPNHSERIESGLLSFGSDHDWDTDPFEVGLGAYVDLDRDDDFIGKQALIERRDRPGRRPVVNIRLDGEPQPFEHPLPALVDGEQVGWIRNAVWAHRMEAWIGLAQVAAPHDAAGTRLEMAVPDGTVTATVQAAPFGTKQI